MAGTDDWKNEFLKKIKNNFKARNFAETKKLESLECLFLIKS